MEFENFKTLEAIEIEELQQQIISLRNQKENYRFLLRDSDCAYTEMRDMLMKVRDQVEPMHNEVKDFLKRMPCVSPSRQSRSL